MIADGVSKDLLRVGQWQKDYLSFLTAQIVKKGQLKRYDKKTNKISNLHSLKNCVVILNGRLKDYFNFQGDLQLLIY